MPPIPTPDRDILNLNVSRTLTFPRSPAFGFVFRNFSKDSVTAHKNTPDAPSPSTP
jgi:hypothetical protein